MSVDDDASLEVDPLVGRYVSRGGHKLAAAIENFDIGVQARRALDVGASTGGFTDCLLQLGAAQVVAVDVGSRQLHSSLRTDPRVVSCERTDIRRLDPVVVRAPFDIVVVDVSFISLRVLAPHLVPFARSDADVVVLVKPQFEAGPGHHSKRGVIVDPAVRDGSCAAVSAAFAAVGLATHGLIASPLEGAAGNREYLLWLRSESGGPPSGQIGEDEGHE